MRSSSFRATSGPLSPSEFPPEENTAPDIYRKQAIRIEELEKENKRLAKEASDGERRWKKAEEELEDLREAEADASSKTKDASTAAGSSEQPEKLVYMIFSPRY
jgi:predicted  nucleic acid-binding Zn-ribbon protein